MVSMPGRHAVPGYWGTIYNKHNNTSLAFSRSFLIFKGFSSRNSQLLVKAFTTYVRPLLEYNTDIWSPNDVGNIKKIERVQCRFTKRIPCVSHLSYKGRLEFLSFDSLDYRRLICDLVIMYKIVHNLIDVNRNSLITINSASFARNSFLKLYKPLCVSSVRSHFLCVRCINVWNYLSEETRVSASISAFKNSLVSYNLLSFLSVFKS